MRWKIILRDRILGEDLPEGQSKGVKTKKLGRKRKWNLKKPISPPSLPHTWTRGKKRHSFVKIERKRGFSAQ